MKESHPSVIVYSVSLKTRLVVLKVAKIIEFRKPNGTLSSLLRVSSTILFKGRLTTQQLTLKQSGWTNSTKCERKICILRGDCPFNVQYINTPVFPCKSGKPLGKCPWCFLPSHVHLIMDCVSYHSVRHTQHLPRGYSSSCMVWLLISACSML